MIKTEVVGNFIKTWSDLNVKIHGGNPEADYDEAYDPIDSGRTYVETDIPINLNDDEVDILEKARAYDILMGNDND